MVTADALRDRLASRDPALLQAVLEASGVRWSPDDEGPALADRLVRALWWRTHSPLGQAVAPAALDGLLDEVGGRLQLDLGPGDAWDRLEALARALVPAGRPLHAAELSPELRRRLSRPVWGRIAGAGAAGSAVGAGWAARHLLGLASGPWFELLKRLPTVGPALLWVRGASGAVAAVSGPLAIGVALLTLNSALGPRYAQAVPLLVGAALALREPLAPA
jgi:hypothetical protein